MPSKLKGLEGNDMELVRQSQEGNRAAFQALVRQYEKKILALVIGMVKVREDALDITQDVFLQAFQNLRSFRGKSSFYTWIYRIAVNRAIDFQRRTWKHRPIDTGTDAVEREAASSSVTTGEPYEEVRKVELRNTISRAISELTPEHRAVILLREIEGLSYAEISETLGCSLGTVMSRLFYARKRLRERLGFLLD
jgi:RNA polymerase sigma-70 factor (ECF subfamily)